MASYPSDQRLVVCAAELLANLSTRFLNPARLPRQYEASVLQGLQKDLLTTIDPNGPESGLQLNLLQRLWRSFFGLEVPFKRHSRRWGLMGFQGTDPSTDIRGGGLLSLECLVYFFERQGIVAQSIFGQSKGRKLQRGEYATYPFACASIAITKRLCELLLLVEPITGRPTSAFRETPSTFWHVVGTRSSFYELFVWVFTSMDEIWDELNATYMDFNRVLNVTVQRTFGVLQRLPMDVVPYSRSRAYYNPTDGGPEPRCVFDRESNDEEVEADDEPQTPAEKNAKKTSGDMRSCEEKMELCTEQFSLPEPSTTCDLLGLDEFVRPEPITYNKKAPTGPAIWANELLCDVRRPLPLSQPADFFDEFGV